MSFKFTIAASGGAIYLPKSTEQAVATSSDLLGSSTTGLYGNTDTALSVLGIGDTPGSVFNTTPCSSCDAGTTTAYVIPDGSSRSFELLGGMHNSGAAPTTGVKNFKITLLYFGATTGNTSPNNFYFDTSFSQMGTLSVNQYLDTVDSN